MGDHQNIPTSVLRSGDKANFPPKEVVCCCNTGCSLQRETISDTPGKKSLTEHDRSWKLKVYKLE